VTSPFDGVGVVLVEFHSGGLVGARAAEASAAGCEVVVADNSGVYDGPGVIVDTGGNVGFGAACNRAVAALPPGVDVVVLQNPDATIERRDLMALIAAVRDGWAAVAPALVTGDVRLFGFSEPRLLREVYVSAREVLRARRSPSADHSMGRQLPKAFVSGCDATARVVERPGRFGSAALLVVDRKTFEAVGGFDEHYFLYVEDLDLWRRLELSGHRVGFAPAAAAVHAEAAGSPASISRRIALRWVARELFVARHQPRHRWRAHRFVHHVLMPALPSGDPIVAAVRRGYALRRDAKSILDDVRLLTGGSEVPPRLQRIRAGWSRTAVDVADDDRVLDVGSGAFPNPRADVLCERTLDRPHRTAVMDRPFVVADVLALPFRDRAFDFVIASHLAEHVVAPDQFCAEIARVGLAGYVETPSSWFERLFPEANHLWRVRRTSAGVLSFEPNRPLDGFVARAGRWLYPWYYAGQVKDRPSYRGVGPLGSVVARSAYLFRGVANRSGLTVTRVRFEPGSQLRCEVRASR